MPQEKRYYTRDEYLAIDQTTGYKSEYLDGEIVPMKGITTEHNQITGNIYAYLKFGLKGKNYRVYFSNVRLWIPRYNQYTFPDIMVIDGEPFFEGTDNTTVTNPSLIVQVSSRASANHSDSDRFRFYRSIPEFREYVSIDQNSCYAEQYTKNSKGNWILTEYDTVNSVLTFDSIDFQLSFTDIYELVNLPNMTLSEGARIDYGF